MSNLRIIKSAFISVWSKNNLDHLIHNLNNLGVKIYSTGGTADFIESLNVPVSRVENLTGYPSILGGRVKTLHPKIFGGILARRSNQTDIEELIDYEIPQFDLVVVDLYPFSETRASGASEPEIIEKIDIGGISLIRAAAKNFGDVVIIPSQQHYSALDKILSENSGETDLPNRKWLAGEAFKVSSHYDTEIRNYFAGNSSENNTPEYTLKNSLRYGENPHQKGFYYSENGLPFTQLHGKEVSYNNILDIDAASALINEFDETAFAILKHTNACGVAVRENLTDAWRDALAGDPVSAFGGVLITNREVDELTASEINKIFFEVIIAPGYSAEALQVLMQKKNRIILQFNKLTLPTEISRSVIGGMLVQERDIKTETLESLQFVTELKPDTKEIDDLIFANKLVKHSKSNAIVLTKNRQLIGSGVGQTSRIDAMKQAIEKASAHGFTTDGAVMASDAFFPFADSVETAWKAGIKSVIQPGGSVRDSDSIEFCNNHKIKMVFTGIRHFKH